MDSPLRDKSHAFAVRIVRLAQALAGERKEFVLGKQVLRSGTATGALLKEAEFAGSRPDFTHKLTIALKEANETECSAVEPHPNPSPQGRGFALWKTGKQTVSRPFGKIKVPQNVCNSLIVNV